MFEKCKLTPQTICERLFINNNGYDSLELFANTIGNDDYDEHANLAKVLVSKEFIKKLKEHYNIEHKLDTGVFVKISKKNELPIELMWIIVTILAFKNKDYLPSLFYGGLSDTVSQTLLKSIHF